MDGAALRADSVKPRRGVLWVAIGGVVLYWLALSVFNRSVISDERTHYPIIARFAQGDWAWPHEIPMPPAYHALLCYPTRLLGGSLTAARFVNLLLALAAIALWRAILGRTPHHGPDDALLHFAWQPLLFPFMVLVYTDTAAVLCVVTAVYLHLRRRYAASGLALLLACALRQSNIVWTAFMATWALVELYEQTPSSKDRGERGAWLRGFILRAARRLWLHAAIGAAAVVGYLVYGRATLGSVALNGPRFNVAQMYLFALFIVFLWLPVWAGRLVAGWRERYGPALLRPSVWVALVAATAVLALHYRSPHSWNEDLRDLKNLPLVGMAESPLVLILVAACLTVAAPLVLSSTLAQSRRRMLAVVWLFSVLFLVPQWLAEPRYYIVPLLLMHHFSRLAPSEARRLSIWYGAICAVLAAIACVFGSAAGGVW